MNGEVVVCVGGMYGDMCGWWRQWMSVCVHGKMGV